MLLRVQSLLKRDHKTLYLLAGGMGEAWLFYHRSWLDSLNYKEFSLKLLHILEVTNVITLEV